MKLSPLSARSRTVDYSRHGTAVREVVEAYQRHIYHPQDPPPYTRLERLWVVIHDPWDATPVPDNYLDLKYCTIRIPPKFYVHSAGRHIDNPLDAGTIQELACDQDNLLVESVVKSSSLVHGQSFRTIDEDHDVRIHRQHFFRRTSYHDT
jgi:hypothetical protein